MMADEKVYFGGRGNGKSFVVSEIQEDHKGDIVGWLRRRVDYPIVGIPGKLAGEIADYIEGLQSRQSRVEPVADCWSNNDGDSWGEHPADADFVDGLKVGDEYELQASVSCWPERFRVTKAPDDASDDYEVEPVSIRTAPQPADPTIKESLTAAGPVKADAAGYTHGPASDGGMDPRREADPAMAGDEWLGEMADIVSVHVTTGIALAEILEHARKRVKSPNTLSGSKEEYTRVFNMGRDSVQPASGEADVWVLIDDHGKRTYSSVPLLGFSARYPRDCKHEFHYFGDQIERRCARCAVIESKPASGEGKK